MNDYPTNPKHLLYSGDGPLACHGCAHSAGGAPYPGRPSGERPCCFCTRNVQREKWVEEGRAHGTGPWQEGVYGVTWTAYYNNQPMKKCPMDCYITTDRIFNDVPEGSHVIT